MLKRNTFSFLALAALLSFSQLVHAQTSDNKWMSGLSVVFMDYLGPETGEYTNFSNFDPGISIGAHAYIAKWLNVSLNSAFVPEVQNYILSEGVTTSTSLVDVNTLLQFKSNGTIFKEEAFFAPYISVGFGLNSASNNLRLYAPGAFGIRFRINKNLSFQVESMYKLPVGGGETNFQHVAHTAGLVFALPGAKKEEDPKPETKDPVDEAPETAENDIFVDTDGDGIPDKDDNCPDEKGLIMYFGCPPEDQVEEDPGEGDIGVAQNDNTNENDLSNQGSTTYDNDVNDPSQNDGDDGMGFGDDGNSSDILTGGDSAGPKFLDDGNDPTPSGNLSEEDIDFIANAFDKIFFKPGSNELTDSSLPVLDKIADILNRNPDRGLQVMGHTDNLGSKKKNQALSVMRAHTVKYYLVYQKGVKLSRISSDGYGPAQPIADNNTAEGRKQNRRVEFKLVNRDDVEVPNMF